ncbi:MAG TPA: hypothetical protein VLZ84_10420 [Asticcacaulis sp.]|nr:hypothetical protein [Asticcacaulis sp.]
MEDHQLTKSLKSIGKSCFVKNFELFGNAEISDLDAMQFLMDDQGYEQTGARTRVREGRRIIEAGRAKDAFRLIADASLEDAALADKAYRLSL